MVFTSSSMDSAVFWRRTLDNSKKRFFEMLRYFDDSFRQRIPHECVESENATMSTYSKFACIYCGQRMKCEPDLCGRHILCPSCQHRIAIPMTRVRHYNHRLLAAKETWDTWVPMPMVEFAGAYPARMDFSAVLAGQAR